VKRGGPFCIDCGRQEDFCRCRMRRRDVMIVLVIFAALLAYVVWISVPPPIEAVPQEQGYRLRPPAVREVPPPQPRRARV